MRDFRQESVGMQELPIHRAHLFTFFTSPPCRSDEPAGTRPKQVYEMNGGLETVKKRIRRVTQHGRRTWTGKCREKKEAEENGEVCGLSL